MKVKLLFCIIQEKPFQKKNNKTGIPVSKKMFQNQRQLYYRLIALWVICEGIAGGIIHGLNIPFSGVIISGFAVICICLIGYYCGQIKNTRQSYNQTEIVSSIGKGAILKATIIVCIFKMLLSPHTPPTAYLAVLFQGLTGQVLFINLKHYKLSCILLGILALTESAVQRVLVLIILYGTGFWNAVNEFIKKLIHVKVISNYSLWLAGAYIFIHAIVGLLVGLMAAGIIKQSLLWQNIQQEYLIADADVKEQLSFSSFSPKRKKIKNWFFIIWIILICLFIQPFLKIGKPLLPSYTALQIFIRSILIFLTWYFLASPLITVWIKKRLQNQKERSANDISQVLLLLPLTENVFRKGWEISASEKGLKRLSLFWKIVLMNTLRHV